MEKVEVKTCKVLPSFYPIIPLPRPPTTYSFSHPFLLLTKNITTLYSRTSMIRKNRHENPQNLQRVIILICICMFKILQHNFFPKTNENNFSDIRRRSYQSGSWVRGKGGKHVFRE